VRHATAVDGQARHNNYYYYHHHHHYHCSMYAGAQVFSPPQRRTTNLTRLDPGQDWLTLVTDSRSVTLETAVGRARVGCDGVRWQG